MAFEGKRFVALIHFAGAAIPLLLVAGAGIWSLLKKEPILRLLTTSGVRAAVSVALIFSWLYAASPRPFLERNALPEYLRMTRREGDYSMQLAGEKRKELRPVPSSQALK
jgi:hypothetical protein